MKNLSSPRELPHSGCPRCKRDEFVPTRSQIFSTRAFRFAPRSSTIRSFTRLSALIAATAHNPKANAWATLSVLRIFRFKNLLHAPRVDSATIGGAQ